MKINKSIELFVRKFVNSQRKQEMLTRQWEYIQDPSGWENQINKSNSEQIAGINCKINEIDALGPLYIIGGKSTNGNNDILSFEWPFAQKQLLSLMNKSNFGCTLLLYPINPFWGNLGSIEDRWIPHWKELYEIFNKNSDWNVYQFDPSFDASGRYFFIARKIGKRKALSPISHLCRKNFHVFFHPGGNEKLHGHSGRNLSYHLCNALINTGANVHSYGMFEQNLSHISRDDILIGHVGPWVKIAYDLGLRNIILYNPVNRWYPTRNLINIESNATIGEQVEYARMIIAQSGSIWRTTQPYPKPEKWRWIDIGVDRNLFPKIKPIFQIKEKGVSALLIYMITIKRVLILRKK